MGDIGGAEKGILGKLGRLFSGQPDASQPTNRLAVVVPENQVPGPENQLTTAGGQVYVFGRQSPKARPGAGETRVDLAGDFPALSRKQLELELELLTGGHSEELQLRVKNIGKNPVIITSNEKLEAGKGPSFILEGRSDAREGDQATISDLRNVVLVLPGSPQTAIQMRIVGSSHGEEGDKLFWQIHANPKVRQGYQKSLESGF